MLCRQEPIVGYMGTAYDGYPAGQQGSPYMPVGLQQQQPPQQTQYRQQPTGARLKVMRCVQLKAPESKRALIDFGLGVGVDLDRQVRMLQGTTPHEGPMWHVSRTNCAGHVCLCLLLVTSWWCTHT